MFVLKSTQNT